MINITKRVVKKEQKNIIRQTKKRLKKERLKYWLMPEDEKEAIRQRSLKEYYKMKSG